MKRLLILFLVATTACINVSRHKPILAAASANAFVQAALVEKNIDKAYGMLDPELQARTSKADFAQVITTMTTPTAPLSINATEFEPIPGQEGMNIYITGESDRETFYYRIPMKGTQLKGYKPVGIFRNQGPYPASSARQRL